MLGKLLKYEIKAMGRIMFPLYLVMIFAACLFAVNMRINMSGPVKIIAERFAIITGFLFVGAVLAVGVVMVIIVIQRFYKNLLGTEGYLMFTLPTRTHEHILSKAISSFLWIVIGIAAGALSGFLMISIVSSVPEFMRELNDVWNQIALNNSTVTVVWICILIAAGIFESLCKVYAAIAVGHQFGNHRLAGSILAYVCFGIIEMLIGLLISHLHILPKAANLFTIGNTGTTVSIRALQLGLLGVAAEIVIYGLLCWYLLDHRLNLE